VNWAALSPQARETATVVGMRFVAGLTAAEVAALIEADPAQIRFNELPRSRRVSTSWVLARVRDLRREIDATSES
jgi:hypothetical protein